MVAVAAAIAAIADAARKAGSHKQSHSPRGMGRHNFGDMLMPHVIMELMGRCGIAPESLIPTVISAGDLIVYGGMMSRVFST